MIISHEYKFIFIKTNKTAGTSVEIALSRFCGPDDVVTKISPIDEAVRESLGGRPAQNYLLPFSEYGVRNWAGLLLKRRRKLKFYNHIGAEQIRNQVSRELWNNYFKFCIERNPWDRVISHYYWHHQHEPRPSLLQYIESGAPRKLRAHGRDLYTIAGSTVVDSCIRFENLEPDLEEVRIRLGLPNKLELPRTKSGTRMDNRSYRETMGDLERQKIADMFGEEIHEFGYTF